MASRFLATALSILLAGSALAGQAGSLDLRFGDAGIVAGGFGSFGLTADARIVLAEFLGGVETRTRSCTVSCPTAARIRRSGRTAPSSTRSTRDVDSAPDRAALGVRPLPGAVAERPAGVGDQERLRPVVHGGDESRPGLLPARGDDARLAVAAKHVVHIRGLLEQRVRTPTKFSIQEEHPDAVTS
jgi:hypothetical protein